MHWNTPSSSCSGRRGSFTDKNRYFLCRVTVKLLGKGVFTDGMVTACKFFWAALLIPAIVFLYLLKRRYTDRTASSTLLWQRVMREMEVTRPWERLRP